MIRSLIVDDEPLARRGIRARLEREHDIEASGEAEDGPAAVEAIRRLRPDVVFLDVQIPGLDGFQVLERIPPEELPIVVFITAYDAHAVQAFEVRALDYLLKPISSERFQECVRRIRAAITGSEADSERQRIRELIEERQATRDGLPASYPRRFAVRERDRVIFVKADDLHAVEAAGNYVMLITTGERHLLRLTLTDMERQLDPARFARIHRSTIVNVDRVRDIQGKSHGDCDVRLEGGAVYRMTRSYRARLMPGHGI